MRSALLLLALPLAGCLPEEPPAFAPEVGESPTPPEHLVVSSVTTRPAGAGGSTPVRLQAPRASDADRVRPDPVFFRIGAGYGAVGQVDLSACRERGLDPGYVHIHVTFGGGGRVAGATVESPNQPPPDALTCIGEKLEAASVPAFEGGDVTLSKSLFVADGNEQGQEIEVKAKPPPAGKLTLAP